jgi:hypothetical protein
MHVTKGLTVSRASKLSRASHQPRSSTIRSICTVNAVEDNKADLHTRNALTTTVINALRETHVQVQGQCLGQCGPSKRDSII